MVRVIARSASALHGLDPDAVPVDEPARCIELLSDVDAAIDYQSVRRDNAMLIIEDLESLVMTLWGAGDHEVVDGLARIIAEGAPGGVFVVAATATLREVPARVFAAFGQCLALAGTDPLDAAQLGVLPGDLADLPPLRAIDTSSGRHVQLATSA